MSAITTETVKLADKLPEVEKKLVETRMKNAKARAEEEKRHLEAMERFGLEDSALLAEHAQCARAKKLLVELVPGAVYRARDLAGSEYRVAASAIKFERDERAAAAEALEGFVGSKEERATLVEQLERADEVLRRAEAKLADLKAVHERAEAAAEAAYQKVRRDALSAAKAERASRA